MLPYFFILQFFLSQATSKVSIPIRDDLRFGTNEMVEYINSLNSTWKAGFSPRLEGYTEDNLHTLLGAIPDTSDHNWNVSESRFVDIDIPANFDSRVKWSYCKTINEIRDQSRCGSCFVFGPTEVMTDRICIASNGRLMVRLSETDPLSCCSYCYKGHNGCEGGSPPYVYEYWVKEGIVTGSPMCQDGCLPYYFDQLKPNDPEFNFVSLPCRQRCQISYKKTFESDKHFGQSHYAVNGDVADIQKEILTNGPVTALFEVFADFLHYDITGRHEGFHSVKIIGWGIENDTPYWLVANSWGTNWGLHGFFKILRGEDECGIESGIHSGLPESYEEQRD